MIHELIATGFFIGRLPYAPGTFGTLLGIPIVYLVSFNPWTVLGTVIFLFIVGLISSNEVIKLTKDQDPEEVVIDEIAGYVACFLFVDPSLKAYILAFIIFRTIDIVKPFPINLFERFHGAYGVMLDDIAAGVLTSFILFLLLK